MIPATFIPKFDYINPLPNELLKEIFLLAVNSLREFPDAQLAMKKVLLAVCGRWHSIMVSTPVFWTKIRLVPPNGSYTEEELISRLNLLTKRAGLLPIHVAGDTNPTPAHVILPKLWSHLARCVPIDRWNSITFGTDGDVDSLPPLPIPQGQKFSALQRLHLVGAQFYGFLLEPLEAADAKPIHVKISEAALPRLLQIGHGIFEEVTDVEVYDSVIVRLNLSISCVLALFPALRVLRMESIAAELMALPQNHKRGPIQLHLKVLSMDSIHMVAALTLDHLYVDQLYPASLSSHVTIPTLEVLHVGSGEMWSLDSLTLPKLEELHLGNGKGSLKACTEDIVRTLEDPAYSLSPSTAVLNTPVTIAVIAWFLRRSERLEHLSLLLDKGACKKVDELISLFKRPELHGKSLDLRSPKLQTLRLVLRWHQVGNRKTGLEVIPSQSWKGVLERILLARAGTPLNSITCEWADGYEFTVRASKHDVET